MATNDTQGWSELLDVVLFEPDRVNLRQRMEHATDAIHRRMEELLSEQPKALVFALGTDGHAYLNGEWVDIVVDLAA